MSWFGAAREWYSAHATLINPIGTFVAAVGAFATAAALAWAGIRNARTAALRHEEQTKADRQRRVTESFIKATEQLASEKIEVRLGGIFTLERISQESPDDYYRIVLETLTAFLREHARWKERDNTASETLVSVYEDENSKDMLQSKPATDIAAVLAVIVRRDYKNPDRERLNDRMLDFRGSDLRGAYLEGAHLEGANLARAHLKGARLVGAHLKRANLAEAHLERARLVEAYLQGAILTGAHLERAWVEGAHLEGANLAEVHFEGTLLATAHLERARLLEAYLQRAYLEGAHLEGANLARAHLKGAILTGAHLEGTKLGTAEGLALDQIAQASGNRETILPQGLTRPEHWTRIS